ncbi:bifunctional phosphoribosyl-AMP cyclohydrolase/phosphoribosyl-ATP diphosphatase HisIE [Campylobacter sp. MIT 21-1685]|uniref:bifunctional phosphoribosyl-AMP cyclohydrolase/phosphoribosyl-ATP diphosphatase HisIE n=1 Tax=unclassified Campylobacter TaxID=2593542 RepID=UPI00224A86C7|nr:MULTISPECIES: bifunctional phosphoribosyl-AMP cyclohydrolase/phosphoribosyl-ATP diphosphatase HisIE [unclassified Campylobacter]MCX2683824.1 bifunctional phosphoribosyl-AMP cyclohydrolase/phosphoribosyl-ATP diphosphatase HisIE [Campylobacter sp. MIT 21-1684]MCX2752104.1 bifunctional phosphoribosyl-AMP cyclohydrolase/phosphoribosyl-ATP diphosphatase HisIE [Campylobacter sp. MIT 21-1682]MCX2808301.1 bifunctional phosphoribosyl-AMP cyclohydrolase/phosphoribosyl-ATP diphosphatase HisIE [Campyloba
MQEAQSKIDKQKNRWQTLLTKIDWQKGNSFLPAIVQDYKSAEVLMLGFMNKEALNKSLQTNKVVFFSRTKNRLWMKGEESGNFLHIVDLELDCDNDTLLVLVNPVGETCHKGTLSCFEMLSKRPDFVFLSRLQKLINERKEGDVEHSYTAKLFQSGMKRIAQKVGEEGIETALAALGQDKKELLNESADLLYHLLVLLANSNSNINEVITTLKERNKA